MFPRHRLFLFLFLCCAIGGRCQSLQRFADSIQSAYKIPELGYAIVKGDSVLAFNLSGVKRWQTGFAASDSDRFHIGSNTKAITALIASELIAEGRLQWTTRFFDLFPELRSGSRKVYLKVTLEQLLGFRGKVQTFSYDSDLPDTSMIHGNAMQQRQQVAAWFLHQPPMNKVDGLTPSNIDYVMAGLMMERASGLSYPILLDSFNKRHGFDFALGQPNAIDSSQTWGHDADLTPIAPFVNYRVEWLQSAGNLNISLGGYVKFMQYVLHGLASDRVFDKLLFGHDHFAYGWWNETDPVTGLHWAYNTGNAGAFISHVWVLKEKGVAFIILTNASTVEVLKGTELLVKEMKRTVSEK